MSTTYTTNYHLGKQEDTSDNFNMSVITANMDTIDTVLGNKADNSTTYTKTEVDTSLGNKADKSTTYTKTEVDTALSGKQSAIDDLSTIRSGAALGATAVQPVTGKGLSTNDYTAAEKTKLAGIAEGAEVNEIQGIKVNNTTINPDANKVVNITVPTTAADVSALPVSTKYAAALSLTINSSTYVMTGQLKDQNGDNLGTAQTIDLPLESVVVGGSYNSQTKKVVLTLQNGNTIEFSVADLVSGLQTELSASNKLNPTYINYDSTHRAVSDTEKSTWNGKQNAIDSSHKLSADLVDDTSTTNKFATAAELEQIETNKNNILSLDAEVDTVANLGAKNLLDLSNVAPTVPSGLTCTNNGDGTYTVSGTLSSANSIKFAILAIEGELILNGCPSDGGDSSYMQRITKNGTAVVNTIDTGSGSNSFTMSGTGYELNFRFAAGTYTNVMFKPMLRPASISDSTYQSYAMSNAELTAAIQALQAQLANQ